jgi:hypothetical protein
MTRIAHRIVSLTREVLALGAAVVYLAAVAVERTRRSGPSR